MRDSNTHHHNYGYTHANGVHAAGRLGDLYRTAGENLFRIGLATGASAAQLKSANCLISDQIFAGQVTVYTAPADLHAHAKRYTKKRQVHANTPGAISTGTPTFTYTPETPILLLEFGNDAGAIQLPGTTNSFDVGER